MSPALRCWSPWWWPLVHLRSFRCRLLDGSLYTLSRQIANRDNADTTKTIANTSIRRRVATTRRRHKNSGHHSHGHAAPRPHPGTPQPRHDGHVQGRHDVQGTTATPRPRRTRHSHSHAAATIAYKGTCPRDTTRHAKTQSHKRSNVAPCNKHPRGGVPPGAKSKAAGSLVLTLNARWNIFGLPVTYEVFTYLVVATVSAPYILCIMFLGLMLMVVERSSGPHRYLAAITHCA